MTPTKKRPKIEHLTKSMALVGLPAVGKIALLDLIQQEAEVQPSAYTRFLPSTKSA
jgi:GTP1/Obg family GTP-binding protein